MSTLVESMLPQFLMDAIMLLLAIACIISLFFGVIVGLFYSQTAIGASGLPVWLVVFGLLALFLIPQSVLERIDTTASHVWRIFVLSNASAFSLGTFVGYLPALYRKKLMGPD